MDFIALVTRVGPLVVRFQWGLYAILAAAILFLAWLIRRKPDEEKRERDITKILCTIAIALTLFMLIGHFEYRRYVATLQENVMRTRPMPPIEETKP